MTALRLLFHRCDRLHLCRAGRRGAELARQAACAPSCRSQRAAAPTSFRGWCWSNSSPQLGQTIVVENRAGAGGTIGAASWRAGQTRTATRSRQRLRRTRSRRRSIAKLNYDPVRDFAAVIPFGISPNVLVVSPAKGFKTVGDLVAADRARPGAFTFLVGRHRHRDPFERGAVSGSAPVLDALHVPFKGGAEAMSEVIAGRIDFFFGPPGAAAAAYQGGHAHGAGGERHEPHAALPEVPTTREAGFNDAEYPIWFGLFVPARTPRDIVERLHQETLKALQAPKVRERMSMMAVDPLVMTPSEFDAYVEKEIALNAALVQKIGIKSD